MRQITYITSTKPHAIWITHSHTGVNHQQTNIPSFHTEYVKRIAGNFVNAIHTIPPNQKTEKQ